ncbi:hypothetical protein EGP98_05990 [bacterium]|jgi:hypothetical protein|nr:hypothetical protein [bacterium]
MAYNDSVYFQQEKIQQVVSRLTETKDSMIKIKNELIEYNNQQLKSYWSTAGSILAQSRLESFINNDVQGFIDYINARIEELDSSISYVNQMDEA